MRNGVLIFMPTLFVGGSEKQVRYIIDGLSKISQPVYVIVGCRNKENCEEELYVKAHQYVHFIFLNINYNESSVFIIKFKTAFLILTWMIRNAYKKKIRWVMFTNLTGLITIPICKLAGCKILFNERNPGVKMCSNIVKRSLLKMSNKIVANSKNAATYMGEKLHRNIEVINNGIVSIKKHPNNNDVEKRMILLPARITPVKNQLVAIQAINILKEQGENYRLLLAGATEDLKYEMDLKIYVKDNAMNQNIEFLGYISYIQEYYEHAELIILPSYEEGTPNVLLESYANRKLCLASDIVMNRDVCVNPQILFNPNDAKQLASKIKWINQLDICLKEDLLLQNYKFVTEQYNLEKMQQRYIEIFES